MKTTDKLRVVSLLYLLAGILAILVPVICGISMSNADGDSGAGATVCLILFIPVITFYFRLALKAQKGDIKNIQDKAAMGILLSCFTLFVVLTSLRKSGESDAVLIVLISFLLVVTLIISIGTLIILRGELNLPVNNQSLPQVRQKINNVSPQQTKKMFCGSCGKQLPHGAIYCSSCGKKSFDEGNK